MPALCKKSLQPIHVTFRMHHFSIQHIWHWHPSAHSYSPTQHHKHPSRLSKWLHPVLPDSQPLEDHFSAQFCQLPFASLHQNPSEPHSGPHRSNQQDKEYLPHLCSCDIALGDTRESTAPEIPISSGPRKRRNKVIIASD